MEKKNSTSPSIIWLGRLRGVGNWGANFNFGFFEKRSEFQTCCYPSLRECQTAWNYSVMTGTKDDYINYSSFASKKSS